MPQRTFSIERDIAPIQLKRRKCLKEVINVYMSRIDTKIVNVVNGQKNGGLTDHYNWSLFFLLCGFFLCSALFLLSFGTFRHDYDLKFKFACFFYLNVCADSFFRQFSNKIIKYCCLLSIKRFLLSNLKKWNICTYSWMKHFSPHS